MIERILGKCRDVDFAFLEAILVASLIEASDGRDVAVDVFTEFLLDQLEELTAKGCQTAKEALSLLAPVVVFVVEVQREPFAVDIEGDPHPLFACDGEEDYDYDG